MSGSSVTGKGIGDSHGKHKCGNQCGGCGCKCQPETTPKTPPIRSCFVKMMAGQKGRYQAGGNGVSNRVC
jgi:hypothetical protein